jgi:ABC-type antimicrobial peptide transport system permease subunit
MSMQQAFLNSLLLTVIIFLGVLASQLLYSLMLSDVDAKTYSFGMLRSLGMRKQRLIGLITIQSLFYAIPGLFGGLICAYVLNVACRYAMFTISFNATSY